MVKSAAGLAETEAMVVQAALVGQLEAAMEEEAVTAQERVEEGVTVMVEWATVP